MVGHRTGFLATAGVAALQIALAQPVLAQAAADTDGGEIIVTGTRREGVSELTSTTPVDVIGEEQLASTGTTNLGQALQTLSPSINFPMNRANTVATSTKQVSLRGLSPDETLVLVNGKRWYPSAGVNTGDSFGRGSQAVDLAALPVVGISRIEVLRDGASAQYGSDAVAGVVNVVLRTGEKGGEIRAESGLQVESGDGWSRYIGGWAGIGLGEGVLTLSGEWQKTDFVPLNKGRDTRQYYNPTTPEKEASAPLRNWHTGLGESEFLSLAATLDMPLTDKLKLYGLANYSKRTTKQYSPSRLPSSTQNVLAVTPDGYQIYGWGKPRDYAGLLGLQYTGDADTLDVSFSYGRNDLILESETENPSYGAATPRHFYLGKLSNRQANLSADYTREFDFGLANPLTFSAGAAYRRDSYRQFAGQVESYSFGGVTGVPIGAVGGGYVVPNASDYDSNRNSYGGYIGLEGDPLDGWSIGLAGRVEHFSDFGTAWTGKASTRIAITPAVALRASINNAFKAPSIGQLSLYSSTSQQIAPTTAVPSGRVEILLLPSASDIALAAGASPLKPEKSLNVSGGLVLTPMQGLSLTVDGYYIRIKDRIALSATLSGATINGLLTAAGYPTIYGVQYFVNMGTTSTRGVDAVMSYSVPLGTDKSLNLSVSGTYNKNKIDKVTTGSFGGTPLINYSTVLSLFYNATPKYRLVASETLKLGNFSLQATQSYYGRYGGANNQAPGTEFWFDPLVTADFVATFTTEDKFAFTLGLRNAFGAKPEMVPNSGNGGRLSNSSLAIINPGGAVVFIGVSKKF